MYLNWSIPVIKLALFSAIVALMICCHRKPETTQPAMENIMESVYASGIIKGANQYRVYSTVNGLIDKVLVSEGELIRKGTPVMSLVGNVARLNAENAELTVAYASITANTERLDELKNALSLAKLKLGNEQSLWSRQKTFGRKKSVRATSLSNVNSITTTHLTLTRRLNSGIRRH
ncbi:efflux RND transporter periplasmic adaptor subunit [Dyadobacter pollutisoli]|uniref:Efflux RND transporter periplasmic adaptor subunit n=1 Tax=Dyadobacter pollutisoli TaxID=2910158 RepID=A0A9E8NFG7_9BACT|nr:efflux RND transporter periplasmic adaptor subunit [Dyadobacter pollutisoli]WAC13317.1 efflux RND transporter periplasmic adaptor subunit [Dyadobacter pollutisoli]